MNRINKTEMTPRERVRATVKGQPVDRVPVMYWLNPHATIRMISEFRPSRNPWKNFLARKLWKYFKQGGTWFLSEERSIAYPHLFHWYGNQEYAMDLGADMINVSGGKAIVGDDGYYFENGRVQMKDAFGGTRAMGGIYIEVMDYPVKSAGDLKNLEMPDVMDDHYFESLRKFRKKYPDICIYADIYGPQELLCANLMEISQALMLIHDEPGLVYEYMGRVVEWSIPQIRKIFQCGADAVIIGDDYGYTGSTFISPDVWKELTLPHVKRMIGVIHEEGGIAMLHSCGYVVPLIPHFIDAGLDILQSVQPKAGNDFETLYREYGDRLTFATGIDTQQGESMTPEELREDILRCYHIGGRKGRHILTTTHFLQPTMPLENIRAIFNTMAEIQAGMHGG